MQSDDDPDVGRASVPHKREEFLDAAGDNPPGADRLLAIIAWVKPSNASQEQKRMPLSYR